MEDFKQRVFSPGDVVVHRRLVLGEFNYQRCLVLAFEVGDVCAARYMLAAIDERGVRRGAAPFTADALDVHAGSSVANAWCCGALMRRAPMPGFICHTCERFQHDNGKRTAGPWWKELTGACAAATFDEARSYDRKLRDEMAAETRVNRAAFDEACRKLDEEPSRPVEAQLEEMYRAQGLALYERAIDELKNFVSTPDDGMPPPPQIDLAWWFTRECTEKIGGATDPLDEEIDGWKLRDLIDWERELQRGELATMVSPTPLQRAAVSAWWSAQLRAKVAASEAERRARDVTASGWDPHGEDRSW